MTILLNKMSRSSTKVVQNGTEHPDRFAGSVGSGTRRLLKTGILSLLFHLFLAVLLIFSLSQTGTKDRPSVYRVTVRPISLAEEPVLEAKASPDLNKNLPIPVRHEPKIQIPKKEKPISRESKREEPEKSADPATDLVLQTALTKVPLEERKQSVEREEEKEIIEPIPLPFASIPTSAEDPKLKNEDSLPILLSLLSPEEKNKNTIPTTGPGEGDGSGAGSGGSGRGPGDGRGELSGKAGNGSGSGPGQEGPGRGGSGNGQGIGHGGFGGKGSGDGSGQGGGGSGGSGSGSGLGQGGRGGGNGGASIPRSRFENPRPDYPKEAREKGYQGEVLLRVEVLPNGRVGELELKKSSGYKLLDQSALDTVKRWRFIPATKAGTPIPFWVNIPIKFQLL